MRGSTKILDIMTPRVGLVVLGCGHVGDILNMLNFNEIFYNSPGQKAD